MQTAAEAHQKTNDTLSGLTFIDILISGATISGSYSINLDGNTISTDMRSTLISNGYRLDTIYYGSDETRSFPRLIVSW